MSAGLLSPEASLLFVFMAFPVLVCALTSTSYKDILD